MQNWKETSAVQEWLQDTVTNAIENLAVLTRAIGIQYTVYAVSVGFQIELVPRVQCSVHHDFFYFNLDSNSTVTIISFAIIYFATCRYVSTHLDTCRLSLCVHRDSSITMYKGTVVKNYDWIMKNIIHQWYILWWNKSRNM